MKLKTLLNNCEHQLLNLSDATEITGVAYDSRRVQPGHLFVAMQGEVTDGNRYIEAALEAGAAAVASEHQPEAMHSATPWIVLSEPRRALATIGRNFYQQPDSELTLVGITGTNGKTSTAHVLTAIFEHALGKTGLIGTIEHRISDQRIPASLTTPESLDTMQLLRRMQTENCAAAVMEASSAAIDRHRVADFNFDAVVFTNLSRDHLDYHGTMEDYFAAKAKLFAAHENAIPIAVINIDDEYGLKLARQTPLIKTTCGRHPQAAVRLLDATSSTRGVTLSISYQGQQLELTSRLLGSFNVENILVAVATALALGIDPAVIPEAVASVPPVRGRLEPIPGDYPFQVLIDYAHTDDGLLKVLEAVNEIADNRVIAVFGAGGDRDRGKRPIMGQHAMRLCDVAVLTSDNPRTEDPEAIIQDVVDGAELVGAPRAFLLTITDRREAIEHAVALAEPGDVIVIAGKGHEDYQIIGTTKFPFDDLTVAQEALKKR